MTLFRVCWTELYAFEADVAANSLEDAIELVKDDPSLYAKDQFSGEYVDGTMEINYGFTKFVNDEATKEG